MVTNFVCCFLGNKICHTEAPVCDTKRQPLAVKRKAEWDKLGFLGWHGTCSDFTAFPVFSIVPNPSKEFL